MKKFISLLVAIAALTSSPAFAQEGEPAFDAKRCQARCKEILKPQEIKKEKYDHQAVQNDPTKTDAEKARSHKDAVNKTCRAICTDG